MKIIRVGAALIIFDGKVLAAERGYGEWKGYWKFRAASRKKVRPERREIREELGADISIDSRLCTTTHQYSHGLLSFSCGKTRRNIWLAIR